MKYKLLVLIFSLAGTFNAYAEFLPSSFSSKFEQEYISTLKGKTKKGQGSVEYRYPGQIRFETNTPSTVIFVSNGAKAWYYRAPFMAGEQGEVTETSAKDGTSTYTKFFDALKNGLSSNEYYEVKKTDPVTLSFTAKGLKELGIKESSFYFRTKGTPNFSELEAIELVFSDGKKTKLKFSELKTNPAMASDRFNFTPPANTKVTN